MSGQYHVELRRRSLRYYTMESCFTPQKRTCAVHLGMSALCQ